MDASGRVQAGIYAPVSTADQNTGSQPDALRRYAATRGWNALEYVDHGLSGAKSDDRSRAGDRGFPAPPHPLWLTYSQLSVSAGLSVLRSLG